MRARGTKAGLRHERRRERKKGRRFSFDGSPSAPGDDGEVRSEQRRARWCPARTDDEEELLVAVVLCCDGEVVTRGFGEVEAEHSITGSARQGGAAEVGDGGRRGAGARGSARRKARSHCLLATEHGEARTALRR